MLHFDIQFIYLFRLQTVQTHFSLTIFFSSCPLKCLTKLLKLLATSIRKPVSCEHLHQLKGAIEASFSYELRTECRKPYSQFSGNLGAQTLNFFRAWIACHVGTVLYLRIYSFTVSIGCEL